LHGPSMVEAYMRASFQSAQFASIQTRGAM